MIGPATPSVALFAHPTPHKYQRTIFSFSPTHTTTHPNTNIPARRTWRSHHRNHPPRIQRHRIRLHSIRPRIPHLTQKIRIPHLASIPKLTPQRILRIKIAAIVPQIVVVRHEGDSARDVGDGYGAVGSEGDGEESEAAAEAGGGLRPGAAGERRRDGEDAVVGHVGGGVGRVIGLEGIDEEGGLGE